MKLKVYLNMYGIRREVGLLYENSKRVFFEYSKEFIDSKIQISPFKLPLKTGVFEEKTYIFDGLYGVFNDSLPDGWGKLLIDRKLLKNGLTLKDISPLNRLSIIGKNPIGALEYEPADNEENYKFTNISLDSLSNEIKKVLNSDEYLFDQLRILNGSSGGARPKIIAYVSEDKKTISHETQHTNKKYSEWIIKFPTAYDPKNIGETEYLYSIAAKEAGINMPETYLFKSKNCKGYFGTKRFDRISKGKIHIHSVCGLLHAPHLINSIDYENILKLTFALTKDEKEVVEMVRRMVFNVKANNRDDHSKNFSFLIDESNNWKLAPAYDLTPSAGFNGEHTSTVNGKGTNISDSDLIKVSEQAGIKKEITKEIIHQVETAIKNTIL